MRCSSTLVHLLKNCGLTVAALLITSQLAPSQINRATLVGRVSDSSGAVVPGADILVIRSEANQRFPAVSTATGDYTVPNLPEGIYEVRVSAKGFRTESHTSIKLDIGSTMRVDFVLQVGDTSSVVNVAATPSLLRTDNVETGQVVSNRELVNLPNNSRDFLNMLTLVAGVAPSRGSLGDGSLDTRGFNVEGSRRSDNVVYMDGTMIVEGNGATTFFPNIDALQEVEVKTSLYSAEFGIKPGGQISTVTKTGTNKFHATVYEFHQRNSWGSRSFFDLSSRPPQKRNQFGAVLSGPVYIPKLYNGRNRLWFVFAYQGLRLQQRVNLNALVPTQDQRQGQFTTPIVDPTTGTPFLNNQIPAYRISSIAAKLLPLWPNPNFSGTSYNYVSPNSFANTSTDQYIGKIDFAESDHSQWSARFMKDSSPILNTSPFQAFSYQDPLDTWSQNLTNTRIFSPKIVNEAGVHYFLRPYALTAGGSAQFPSFGPSIGIPNWPITSIDVNGVPSIAITGAVTGIGSGSTKGNVNVGNFEVKDNLTFITGAHSFKTGYTFHRQFNFYVLNSRSGITFANKYTGNNLADFLLGLPSSSSLGGELLRGNFAENGNYFYFQDDWKVTSKLTLNLGIRYEYRGPWKDKRGFMTNVDPQTAAFMPPAQNLNLQPGQTGRFTLDAPLVTFSKNGWQPRVGLAYRLTSNTVVRAGYGLFGNEPPVGFIQYLGQNPRAGTTPLTFLSDLTTPTLSLSDPFNTGAQRPGTGLQNIYGVQQNLPASVVHTWGATIQQQFGGSTTVELAYVGRHGVHDFVQYAWNDAISGTTPRQTRRPFPQYNSFTMVFADGTSSYNGIEARLQHRPRNTGLSLVAGYTVGKGIDDVGGRLTIPGDPSTNTRNLARSANRGLSESNIPGRLSVGGVYELPFGKAKSFASSGIASVILGGWVLDGLLQAQRGPYITPAITPSSVDSGSSADQRPNVARNPNLPSDQQTVTRWFDTSAFSAPPAGQYGNAGRSIIQAPGYVNVDAGVQRVFAIVESAKLSFRFEGFNVANHPNFNLPDATFGSTTFGAITSTLRPRDLQVGLKLVF